MSSDNFVDNSGEIRYNISNVDENQNATPDAAHSSGELVERIHKKDLKPLNDPACQHANAVRDDTEELGIAFSCPDCGLGWLFEKT